MNFDHPRISVIIVNWNRKGLLREAIESLLNDGYDNLEIIVVDNASVDGSTDLVRSEFPNVVLIENRQNVGFARGNNQGIVIALQNESEFILFLNNDAVVTPGCLTELIRVMKAMPDCGAVSPFIVYAVSRDLIWYGGGSVNLLTGQIKHLHIRKKFDPGAFEETTTGYITGCAMMVRTTAIQQAGVFDLSFGLYSEDVDLCLRIRRAGWSLMITPNALAAHRVSSSTGGGLSPLKAYYRARSTAILLKRWAGWRWVVLAPAGSIGLFLAAAGLTLKGDFSIARALVRGIWDGMTDGSIPPKFQLKIES